MSAVVCAPQWTATSSLPAQVAEEEVGDPLPLRQREEDPLPRRPHRQDSVQPTGREEADQGLERLLVEARPAVAEWRHSSGQSALDHCANLMLRDDELASDRA